MADRTLNLNLTWEDDDAKIVKWETIKGGQDKDASLGYCNFTPPLNSTGTSCDWSEVDSSAFFTHPNDPKDPFNQPPQRFDNTIQSEVPSDWADVDNSTWAPLRRGPHDANETMFLENSALDFPLDQTCDRPPCDWPDRQDSLFPNKFPPAWGEAGPPTTPPRATSPTDKTRVAKTADNQNISYTTQRPKIVSRIPRLKPTHNPQVSGAGAQLQRLQPDPNSRIPVLTAHEAPAAPQAPPGRFPPGMEGLLQEGPAAAEAGQAMRVHVKGCKGACGGTVDVGGCVIRKYGRIHQ